MIYISFEDIFIGMEKSLFTVKVSKMLAYAFDQGYNYIDLYRAVPALTLS